MFLLYFVAMLQNFAYYAQIMFHIQSIVLHQFNISFFIIYKIMSISSL